MNSLELAKKVELKSGCWESVRNFYEIVWQKNPELFLTHGFGKMLKKIFSSTSRVVAIGFGGFNDAVNGCARPGSIRSIRKKPVLSAKNKRPDGIFDNVVVRTHKPALCIPDQLGPLA